MTQAVMPLCQGVCGEERCMAYENVWRSGGRERLNVEI